MAELVEPTVAVPASFLTAMQEFADEGRAGDNTIVGRDLAKWGGRWNTDDGFGRMSAVSCATARRRCHAIGMGAVHHAVVD
jgi:hypothetical protein